MINNFEAKCTTKFWPYCKSYILKVAMNLGLLECWFTLIAINLLI